MAPRAQVSPRSPRSASLPPCPSTPCSGTSAACCSPTAPGAVSSAYTVEQAPWTRAGDAASLLARAWLDAAWTGALTRWLSRALERDPRAYLLLFAYLEHNPVGVVLVQMSSVNRLHLWAVLEGHAGALEALLGAAANLGGPFEVSGPEGRMPLEGAVRLAYWRGA